MIDNCHCCDGLDRLTPAPRYNRPGLAALKYRTGTYATFLETMLARLTTLDLSDDPAHMLRPLLELTTRELDDPSIALLDAWAVLADVLTFYQERLANEGFLRTAQERRSILELGRLVGYELRPGVAASVFLAFTVEDPDPQKPILIPAGMRVQSLPNPGELPQSFETSDDLMARAAWNVMRPRLSQVQDLGRGTHRVQLKGLGLNLKPNDPMLIVDSNDISFFRQVFELEPIPDQEITTLYLRGDLDLGDLEQLSNKLPELKNRDQLPKPEKPTDQAKNVPTNQIFRWTYLNHIPQTTKYKFQLREQRGENWLEEHDNITGLSFTPKPLDFDKPYEWRVTVPADDDCAEYRGLWQFTTIGVNIFTDETVIFLVQDESTVSWSFSWIFHTDESNVTFRIKLWQTGEEPKEYINEPNTESQLEIIELEGSSLPTSGTFYWKVFAIQDEIVIGQSEKITLEVESLEPPADETPSITETVTSSTILNVDDERIFVANTLVLKLQEKLSNLQGDLKDTQKAIERLEVEIEVAKAALNSVLQLLTWINDENEVFDIGCYIIWVNNTAKTLDNLIADLGVRQGVSSVIDRVFPGKFVDFDSLSFLAKYLKNDLSVSLQIARWLEQLIRESIGENDTLNGFIIAQFAAVTTADEQISIVKQELYLLEVCYHLSEQLRQWSDNADREDFSNLSDWIGKPESQRKKDEEATGLVALFEQLIIDEPITGTQSLESVVEALLIEPSKPPATALQLKRDVSDLFSQQSNLSTQLLAALKHPLKDSLYQTWAQTEGKDAALLQSVEALKVKSTHFGATSPPKIIIDYNSDGNPRCILAEIRHFIEFVDESDSKVSKSLILDTEYKEIKPGGWVVIEWTGNPNISPLKGNGGNRVVRLTRRIVDVSSLVVENRGKLTKLILDSSWINERDSTNPEKPALSNDTFVCTSLTPKQDPLLILRNIIIYAQSEPLELAEERIEIDVQKNVIHLDRLYQGLEAGRWLIISGERTDIPRTKGVMASERVMIAGIKHVVQALKLEGKEIPVSLTDDKIYTTIELANEGLAYTYKRDTVTIYGNVVKATHGETREEVLGHGDGSQARQSFTLKQPPLTYLAAPTRQGVESTLEVRVNNIRWPQQENLLELGPEERGYVTRTDNEQNTMVIFGDGQQGRRLPTGVENVKAVYRSGIGQAGNVAAEQISQLSTRPLGVKGVINPLAASGGANPETADQARWNVPRALLALDRLVSVSDYEDFARTFAGISKAGAALLFEGRQQVIHLTVAGVDDTPITEDSDLYRALFAALQRYGTLQLPLRIQSRTLKLLVLIAKVKIHPDYLWEVVEPKLRQALLDAFSFARRELGQDALLSEAISVMQTVRGVVYVDVDIFTCISETSAKDPAKLFAQLDEIAEAVKTNSGTDNVTVNLATDSSGEITSAEIAYLSAAVPDTLILKEIKG